MPEAPARNGATARTSPTKRPTRIAFAPLRSKKASTRSSRAAVTPRRGPRVRRNRRPRRLPSMKLARSPRAAAVQATRIIAGRLTSPCAATTPPRTIAVSPGAMRPMNAPVSANASAATSAYVHGPSVSERSVSAPWRSGARTRPPASAPSVAAATRPPASSAMRRRRELPAVVVPVAGTVAGRRFTPPPASPAPAPGAPATGAPAPGGRGPPGPWRDGDSRRRLHRRLGPRAHRQRAHRLAACGRGGAGGRVPGAPGRGRAAKAVERGEADRRGQPDRDRPVREHGGEREVRLDAEGEEDADHPAAHGAGDRDRVGDLADEVAEHDDGQGRRRPERVEHRPQDGGVEAPPGEGAEQTRVAGAHERDRVADGGAEGGGRVADGGADAGEPRAGGGGRRGVGGQRPR